MEGDRGHVDYGRALCTAEEVVSATIDQSLGVEFRNSQEHPVNRWKNKGFGHLKTMVFEDEKLCFFLVLARVYQTDLLFESKRRKTVGLFCRQKLKRGCDWESTKTLKS